MALPSKNSLRTRIRDTLPNHLLSIDLGAQNFFTGVVIQATNQIHIVSHSGQRGALSGCWLPLRFEGHSDGYSKVFSLLHPLNVRLQAAHKFIDKFVLWDVFRGSGFELLIIFIIARLRVLVNDAWLGPRILNPLNHDLILVIVLKIGLPDVLGAEFTTKVLNAIKVASLVTVWQHMDCALARAIFKAQPDLRWTVWRIATETNLVR